MPRTPPPCMKNGILCNDFTPGCRTGCDRYHTWEIIHMREKAQEDSARHSHYGILECTAIKVARALKRQRR